MKVAFVISVFCIYTIGYSQSVVVNYIEKRIISKEKLEATPEFARANALASHNYILEYSNGISFYKNTSEVKNVDSIKEIDTKDERQEKSYRITQGHLEKWYYADFNTDELLFKIYNGKDFYGQDHLLKWDWKITNETKNINGFECKKAISEAFGYYFTAWFTEDIAISAGPDKFNGLPGLILYVGTPYYEYVATSLEVKKEPIVIVKPKIADRTFTMAEVETYVKDGISKLKSSTTTEIKGNTTKTLTTIIIH